MSVKYFGTIHLFAAQYNRCKEKYRCDRFCDIFQKALELQMFPNLMFTRLEGLCRTFPSLNLDQVWEVVKTDPVNLQKWRQNLTMIGYQKGVLGRRNPAIEPYDPRRYPISVSRAQHEI